MHSYELGTSIWSWKGFECTIYETFSQLCNTLKLFAVTKIAVPQLLSMCDRKWVSSLSPGPLTGNGLLSKSWTIYLQCQHRGCPLDVVMVVVKLLTRRAVVVVAAAQIGAILCCYRNQI